MIAIVKPPPKHPDKVGYNFEENVMYLSESQDETTKKFLCEWWVETYIDKDGYEKPKEISKDSNQTINLAQGCAEWIDAGLPAEGNVLCVCNRKITHIYAARNGKTGNAVFLGSTCLKTMLRVGRTASKGTFINDVIERSSPSIYAQITNLDEYSDDVKAKIKFTNAYMSELSSMSFKDLKNTQMRNDIYKLSIAGRSADVIDYIFKDIEYRFKRHQELEHRLAVEKQERIKALSLARQHSEFIEQQDIDVNLHEIFSKRKIRVYKRINK
jgi:hypothetical protein